MSDKFAHEAVRSLHQWGWFVRTDPQQKYATHGETGRPDLLCVRNGWGVHIEVKTGSPGFDFSGWNPKQRLWATEHGDRGHLWFWLTMGTHSPTYDATRYDPRIAFLFPYNLMSEIEERLRPYSGTLPYRTKHQRTEIQEQGLIAPILLKDYHLNWKGKGMWELPAHHPFQIYSRPLPYIQGFVSEKLPNGHSAVGSNP